MYPLISDPRMALTMFMILLFPISLWIYITQFCHGLVNNICFCSLWFLTMPLWIRLWCPDGPSMVTQEFHVRRQYTASAPVRRQPLHFESVRAEREPYKERAMFRALPPVKVQSFTTRSGDDCPICMEEFKDGEMVQPFGVCVHEFHYSCVRPWFNTGKTTCPVCREDLSTALATATGGCAHT